MATLKIAAVKMTMTLKILHHFLNASNNMNYCNWPHKRPEPEALLGCPAPRVKHTDGVPQLPKILTVEKWSSLISLD